jgi:D-glycero-alpha-D-manno-heptose-7-phosphate kinase
MKECLLRGDFGGIVESMRMGWESKKRSARTVSTPYIEEIYAAAIRAGALAGKVSGAGGGGFMLFFVPTERRMDVIRALNSFDCKVSNCHFTKHGAQAWRIS